MRIPVGRQSTRSITREVRFVCQRCGYRGEAAVTGVGEGVESVLNSPGTAEERAYRDAKRDIGRVLRRARCRRCHERSPGAVIGFLSSYAAIAVALVAVGVALGWAPTWFDIPMRPSDKAICTWLVPVIVAGSSVIVVGLQAMLRWSATDAQIEWLERDE